MRIVSLVPSATEIVFALGAEPHLVAVTHECDYPSKARELPVVTRNLLDPSLSAAEIDSAVRDQTKSGQSIYGLDRDRLAALEPDVILTQELCSVCAVSYEEVCSISADLDPPPTVIASDPHTLGEVLLDIRRIGDAISHGEQAERLVGDLGRRIDSVREKASQKQTKTVVALEWLDPPYVAGHWTPQLIEYAGGYDSIAHPAENSQQTCWSVLAGIGTDLTIVMPCGYDRERAAAEVETYRKALATLNSGAMAAVDAAAYFSRPGPRLVDGLELLAHALHPSEFDLPEYVTGPIWL